VYKKISKEFSTIRVVTSLAAKESAVDNFIAFIEGKNNTI